MDLLVNVAQLLKEQAGATHTLEVRGPELEIDGAAPAYVSGRIVLTRTGIGIWASGDVAISADATCSRCLVPFTSWMEVRVDDVFLGGSAQFQPTDAGRNQSGGNRSSFKLVIVPHRNSSHQSGARRYREGYKGCG